MGKVNIRGPLARELAVEIVRNGGTYAEASEQTGFGESYIRQLCAKQGFKQAKTSDKENHARIALSMIDEGKTVKEIMTACGYKSAASVYALCRKHKKQSWLKTEETKRLFLCICAELTISRYNKKQDLQRKL